MGRDDGSGVVEGGVGQGTFDVNPRPSASSISSTRAIKQPEQLPGRATGHVLSAAGGPRRREFSLAAGALVATWTIEVNAFPVQPALCSKIEFAIPKSDDSKIFRSS